MLIPKTLPTEGCMWNQDTQCTANDSFIHWRNSYYVPTMCQTLFKPCISGSCCCCNELQTLSRLKQHRFIILHPGGWKPQIKPAVRAVLLLQTLGNPFPGLGQFLEAICILWLVEPSFIFKVDHSNLYFHHYVSCFWL